MMCNAIGAATCSNEKIRNNSVKAQFHWHNIKQALRQWHHNYSTRRQLAALDNSMLSDIAISRADALREAKKPFWKS